MSRELVPLLAMRQRLSSRQELVCHSGGLKVPPTLPPAKELPAAVLSQRSKPSPLRPFCPSTECGRWEQLGTRVDSSNLTSKATGSHCVTNACASKRFAVYKLLWSSFKIYVLCNGCVSYSEQVLSPFTDHHLWPTDSPKVTQLDSGKAGLTTRSVL